MSFLPVNGRIFGIRQAVQVNGTAASANTSSNASTSSNEVSTAMALGIPTSLPGEMRNLIWEFALGPSTTEKEWNDDSEANAQSIVDKIGRFNSIGVEGLGSEKEVWKHHQQWKDRRHQRFFDWSVKVLVETSELGFEASGYFLHSNKFVHVETMIPVDALEAFQPVVARLLYLEDNYKNLSTSPHKLLDLVSKVEALTIRVTIPMVTGYPIPLEEADFYVESRHFPTFMEQFVKIVTILTTPRCAPSLAIMPHDAAHKLSVSQYRDLVDGFTKFKSVDRVVYINADDIVPGTFESIELQLDATRALNRPRSGKTLRAAWTETLDYFNECLELPEKKFIQQAEYLYVFLHRAMVVWLSGDWDQSEAQAMEGINLMDTMDNALLNKRLRCGYRCILNEDFVFVDSHIMDLQDQFDQGRIESPELLGKLNELKHRLEQARSGLEKKREE